MKAHSLDCDNAWLSPEGRLRPNPAYGEHSNEADAICSELGITELPADPEDHLIKLGWVKLRSREWYLYRGADNLTQKQRNTIFDWCLKASVALPPFMAPVTEPETVYT